MFVQNVKLQLSWSQNAICHLNLYTMIRCLKLDIQAMQISLKQKFTKERIFMVNKNLKFFWTYSVGMNGLLISFLVLRQLKY